MGTVVFLILLICFADMTLSLQNQTKENHPSKRIYHSMLYHSKTNLVLLFGGQSRPRWGSDLKDIWSFDVKNNVWKEEGVYMANPGTEKGLAHSPAYDAESDRIIVLNSEGETWSFDFKIQNWEKMNPEKSPSARAGQKTCYDSESDRIIIFGGFKGTNANDPIYNDTWSYDYNTDTWTLMKPENPPGIRMYHVMAYDSVSDRVILWGGRVLKGVVDNSIWAYDFNSDTWEKHETVSGPDPAMTYSAMDFHPPTGKMILYGGATLTSTFEGKVMNQTWSYHFKTNKWELIKTENTPPGIRAHAMAYNAKEDKFVVFGGELERPYSNKPINEIWIFDPVTKEWQKK
jgi:N-acetylneuraminic acid mutarotase